jgi:adenine-specific DNA-methyltransferase
LAIYDERKIHTSEKCLIIIPRDKLPKNASQFSPKTELELKYLIAVLNSRLIDFYYASVYGGFIDVYPNNLKELPIANSESKKRNTIIGLVNLLLFLKMEENRDSENLTYCQYIDYVIDGCIYELYFGEEMKKAGVDILALVEKDLEAVKKLSPEKAIANLYEKWQEPKNEVRNRLLLMSTRCPDTIGVVEASVK